MEVERKLEEMGLILPPKTTPLANYVPCVRTGNLLFVSGHGPVQQDGTIVRGKVGDTLTQEEGYEAARLVCINMLSAIKNAIGDLDKLHRVVKVLGMVNATDSFKDHPAVINGCSDLLVEAFGERGKHARSAVGMGSLPMGIAVEIEMIVEVED